MKNFKLILLLIAFSVSHVVSLVQEIDTLNQLLEMFIRDSDEVVHEELIRVSIYYI